jgi:hypothetical protein
MRRPQWQPWRTRDLSISTLCMSTPCCTSLLSIQIGTIRPGKQLYQGGRRTWTTNVALRYCVRHRCLYKVPGAVYTASRPKGGAHVQANLGMKRAARDRDWADMGGTPGASSSKLRPITWRIAIKEAGKWQGSSPKLANNMDAQLRKCLSLHYRRVHNKSQTCPIAKLHE